MQKLALTLFRLTLVLTVFTTPAYADPLADSRSKVKVAPAVPLQAQAFALQDVRLLDGPFQHAMELDRQYLLSLQPAAPCSTPPIRPRAARPARPLLQQVAVLVVPHDVRSSSRSCSQRGPGRAEIRPSTRS
jgi:hypothetical protein